MTSQLTHRQIGDLLERHGPLLEVAGVIRNADEDCRFL